MSMLRSLFGKRDLASLVSEADALFADERYGEAKLAYDRVAERAKKERPETAVEAEQRADACCDALALARLAEAEHLRKAGEDELAKEELRHASDTARSAAVQERVRAARLALEDKKTTKREQATEVAPLSDEEHLMLITGRWEPAQAEELERYGEPLLDALLAAERGEAERALALITPLFAGQGDARFLWLELAHVQLAREQPAEAEKALRTFLSKVGAARADAARIGAHRELARIAHDRGDRDAAVAELEACAEALEDDPRPLLDLGNYLRMIERPQEAVEVLELCVGTFKDRTVEWPVTLELGLACAGAGDEPRAIALLEAVVSGLLGQGNSELPVQAVVPLAKLHEKAGNLARAADLYRTLADGIDPAEAAPIYVEAARLLDVLGLTDEAARLRARTRGPDADPSVP